MRLIGLLLLAATLSACTDIFGPDDVTFQNRRPLEPVPTDYRALYFQTAKCLGIAPRYDDVRWSVADEIMKDGQPAGAATTFPDDITMRWDHVNVGTAVRHESAHHLTRRGDSLHLPDGGVPCDGVH
jgi:hypothetical protein